MTDPTHDPVDHEKLLREALAGAPDRGKPSYRLPEPEDLARLFPDYEVLGLLGRGGMAAVYKAVQKRLDRLVAIKVLPAELAKDPEFGERFMREARALASLNHPHVLTVHDFGRADGLFYLVTELVDGVDLRQLMDLGKLSPAEALRIVPQLCRALQYAHDHGVVHRDVKPENILIDTTGQVKIADFGLAKLARLGDPIGLTSSSAVFGTPSYMAPEQWRGSATVDHRADIFSLGVVLYEMLTGQLPIGSFDPPSKRSGVPPGLDEVVRRTLAQQPDDRYQSARDVETDIELRAASAPATVPDGSPRRPRRTESPTALRSGCAMIVMVVLVLALLGLAALAFLLVAPGSPNPSSTVQAPIVSGPVSPADLVGASAAEVVARLGPPAAISVSADTADWSYRKGDGTVSERALIFDGDRVASYDHDAAVLQPGPIPSSGAYLGQPIAELEQRLGPATSRSRDTLGTTVTFEGDVQVTVVHGIVVAIASR